jgi:hypothetical protein
VGRFLTKQELKTYWRKSYGFKALCALLEIELKCILLLDAGKSPESISEYLFLSRKLNACGDSLKKIVSSGNQVGDNDC